MSGIEIIGELLRADAALIATVPVDRIKAGQLPENEPLPALLVRTISVVDSQPLKWGATVRSAARIAVTVRAASYREQIEIIRLVRAACAGKLGAIAGAERVSVRTAGTGPDVVGPGNTFEQTQDLTVSFIAPA